MDEEQKETLVAMVKPDDATDKSVTWSSSDATVSVVSEIGEVTAVKAGMATITATSVADNSKKAICTVMVTKVETEAFVGSFYYSDKTFSTTFNVAKTCIGIVFMVNADGASGKIVGLTEPEANWNSGTNAVGKLTWGLTGTVTSATDKFDGSVSMAVIKVLANWQTNYPAFVWADSRDIPVIAGIKWYLPTTNELLALYGTDGATMRVVNSSLYSVRFVSAF